MQAARCSCCGEERPSLVALLCHADIAICSVCIGWLRSQSGAPDTTPILPVSDMGRAVAFYERAGFEARGWEDGAGYTFVHYDDESVFDLGLAEEGLDARSNRSGCYVIVADVAAWHRRLTEAQLAVTSLEDKPWGMREFTMTDPDGNSLRIGQGISS